MALFTIADLHLSTFDKTDKSMEVFGRAWDGYMTRLERNWRALVAEDDTVVIPGDVSWALTLEEATSDMKFLDSLPGKKVLGKGNHDFWWTSMKKHIDFFEKNGIRSISFLYHNAIETDEFILAGTRGWYSDKDAQNAPENADFDKLTNRENLRLAESLKAAKSLQEASPEKEILVFLHFPPVWSGKTADGLIGAIRAAGVRRVFFGHIHGNYTVPPTFMHEGIELSLVSADYLGFVPKIIRPAGR